MLEFAHPCESNRNPKQDRHYRWDRCGTPHLCAVYSTAVKNPLKQFCLPEPCSPPFNAHHPDEEISVWDSTLLFTEFCTQFIYWELAEERYLWLIKSPTTPIHPPQQHIHRKTLNPSTQELPQTSMYISTKSYSAQNYFYHNPRHMHFPTTTTSPLHHTRLI
jgi:hypothetical protein